MVSGAGIREIGILASFAFSQRATRSQSYMDPSINSQSFRVGPFQAQFSPAQNAQSTEPQQALAGGSCTAVSCPIIPRARIQKNVIHRDPITEEFVVLELPVSDARKLRALLGSIGVGRESNPEKWYLRTIGRFPCKPGIAGIAGPDAEFFTDTEVSNAAVITYTALRKAGL